MLSHNFAVVRDDDAAGRLDAAPSMGMDATLPAAEPVGNVGGHPAPAPAAAGQGPSDPPDTNDEPGLGGARLAHSRLAMGSGSGEGPVSAPDEGPGPVVPPVDGEVRDDEDPFGKLGPGHDAMDRFVVDYLALLDGRLDTIRRCLDDSDVEGARIAVLSLESSSLMLGGGSLAVRLTELRSHLDLGPTPQRNALMALVEVAASAFRRDLQARHG